EAHQRGDDPRNLTRLRRPSDGFVRAVVCQLFFNVNSQVACVAPSIAHIFLKASAQQLSNTRRSLFWQSIPIGFGSQDSAENVGHIFAAKGLDTRQHFVKYTAKGEEVRPAIDSPPLCLFRRHVRRAAE